MGIVGYIGIGLLAWCLFAALAVVAHHWMRESQPSVPVECQVPAHPTAASNVLKSRRVREPFDWQREEAL